MAENSLGISSTVMVKKSERNQDKIPREPPKATYYTLPLREGSLRPPDISGQSLQTGEAVRAPCITHVPLLSHFSLSSAPTHSESLVPIGPTCLLILLLVPAPGAKGTHGDRNAEPKLVVLLLSKNE